MRFTPGVRPRTKSDGVDAYWTAVGKYRDEHPKANNAQARKAVEAEQPHLRMTQEGKEKPNVLRELYLARVFELTEIHPDKTMAECRKLIERDESDLFTAANNENPRLRIQAAVSYYERSMDTMKAMKKACDTFPQAAHHLQGRR